MRDLLRKIDRRDLQRVAAAAMGALIFSSTMVGSAVWPAAAANAPTTEQGRA